jgi:hypothetical protein
LYLEKAGKKVGEVGVAGRSGKRGDESQDLSLVQKIATTHNIYYYIIIINK